MKKSLLATLLFLLSLNFAFAQNTLEQFLKVKKLTANSLEKTIATNREKGKTPFYDIRVLYTISVTSIKVNEQETQNFLNALKNLNGVLDCIFQPETFTLFVKTEKEFNYVRIEQIKEILNAFSKLQILNYKEELFTRN